MFRRTAPSANTVCFTFNDKEVSAAAGDTIAAALLASGISVFGFNATSGADRGAFCMMGSCFECLVEIDGLSVQACQVSVTDGLRVRSIPQPQNISTIHP